MKAIVCTEYGPPDVLQVGEVETPVAKDNEVLIRVHATSATTGDANARNLVFVPPGLRFLGRLMMGIKRPRNNILGGTFSGEIEAVGKDVTLFNAGDLVYGADGDKLGAYAEYKSLPEDGALALKPANVSHEEAASIPFGALTALYFLRDKGNIRSGQEVLINGASGSVGSAAVQISRSFGARVTGVCGSANVEFVKSLGAHEVIDYSRDDFTRNGKFYDLILDAAVGKTSFSRCKGSLRAHGRYLAVAGGLREMIQMVRTSIIGSRKVVFGGGSACERKDNLVILKELVESQEITPIIDRCFALEQIVDAHRYVDAGHKKGNVAITLTHAGVNS